MANLVPCKQEINKFKPQLTEGEKTLMTALVDALDDSWTVYVQPHLNGLSPDIVIFSENHGLGIFEVKDWNLQHYRINNFDHGEYNWQVYNNQRWNSIKCPFQQVLKYKKSIIDYEIPILKSKTILNRQVYGVVKTFLYFHKHNKYEIHHQLTEIKNISQTKENKYTILFAKDQVDQHSLQQLLENKIIRHGYKYAEILKSEDVSARIRNALAYPQHGNIDLEHLNQPLTKQQTKLLSNTNPPKSKGKRVVGVAGSGKTLVLIHKAVNAAIEEKSILIVCFNITMANYLKECVTRLARSKDQNCHRKIQVFHFHYLFPYEQNLSKERLNLKEASDVILIDEAQDFKREWIEKIKELGKINHHLMIFEDDRQNIYNVDVKERQSVPGIIGRPNILKSSYRIPPQTARLANIFAAQYCPQSLSGSVITAKEIDLFASNLWFNGNNALQILKQDILQIILDPNTARPDIAILVCTVKSGWDVCKILDDLNILYQKTFESEKENLQLQEICQNNSSINFHDEERKLRRGYKVGFWMQSGKIKVSTIHSFKGWELSNILVYFDPSKGQEDDDVVAPLLYTAMTRSQQNLTIYGSGYNEFVDMAVQKGYVAKHPALSKIDSLAPIF